MIDDATPTPESLRYRLHHLREVVRQSPPDALRECEREAVELVEWLLRKLGEHTTAS